jgi:hypothetical protein
VNTLYCSEEWRGKHINAPPGDNFTPGDKIYPWGTTSPLRSKFAPRNEVKNGPLVTLLVRLILGIFNKSKHFTFVV